MYFERIDFKLNKTIETCNDEDFKELHEEKRVLLGFPEDVRICD